MHAWVRWGSYRSLVSTAIVAACLLLCLLGLGGDASAQDDDRLRVIDVDASNRATCLIYEDASAWCWGYNGSGQLGVGSWEDELGPTKLPGEWRTITGANQRLCGLTVHGSPLCWGYWPSRVGSYNRPQGFLNSRTFSVIDVGPNHACGIRSNEPDMGKPACWGENANGKTGRGEESRSVDFPVTVSAPGDHTDIAVGHSHSCALDTGGDAWCWGSNSYGLLGNDVVWQTPWASLVEGDHTFTSLVAGAFHTCALDADSKAWCWGQGWGEPAAGTEAQNEPQPVPGSQRFSSLYASGDRNGTCALDSVGQTWCWSASDQQPSLLDRPPFATLSIGAYHSCGVDLDGFAWCWGSNYNGQIGPGLPDYVTEPVRVSFEAPKPLVYVALGDSYSSGVGTLDDVPLGEDIDALCYRTSAAYSELVAAALRNDNDRDVDFTMSACGGARSYHHASFRQEFEIHGGSAFVDIQASTVPDDVDLITTTMLGNDVGFSSMLTYCALVSSCDRDFEEFNSQVLDWAYARAVDYYSELRDASGSVYVLGYPMLLPVDAPAVCDRLFDLNERLWLRALQMQFNSVLKQAADHVGVWFVPVDLGPGTEACGEHEQIHFVVNPEPWFRNDGGNSFHPTRDAHRTMAELVVCAHQAAGLCQPDAAFPRPNPSPGSIDTDRGRRDFGLFVTVVGANPFEPILGDLIGGFSGEAAVGAVALCAPAVATSVTDAIADYLLGDLAFDATCMDGLLGIGCNDCGEPLAVETSGDFGNPGCSWGLIGASGCAVNNALFGTQYEPSVVEFDACAGGTATFGVLRLDDGEIAITPTVMTEAPSGHYSATFDPPGEGSFTVRTSIACPDGTRRTGVDVVTYIDPSGQITNCANEPVVGASVTLLRAESASGPFTVVPDGSAIMSPENRANPSLTDVEGKYRWDTTAGFYMVEASAAGFEPVRSEVLEIPPPRFDVDLVLGDCEPPPGCDGKTVTIDMNTGASGTGTAGDDVILGTPGDDVIDVGEGDDVVCAGDGNDVVVGGDGADRLFGEGGRDILRGNAGVDHVDGGDGDDRVLGGIDGDTLIGGAGDDYLGGFGGADTIDGGPGNETIFGGFGADTIDGGPGNDVISGLIGNDTINGDDGNDTLNGDRGNDTVNGGAGNDTINGGNGNDVLNGDAGADSVNGGRADDQLSGGAGGNDTCVGNKQNNADTADASCEQIFGVP
jgi:alpha-tubulin suppressor-like RCC1 family protein